MKRDLLYIICIIYRKYLKNNVEIEFIRYNHKILNMNILIVTNFELNDKLYKKIEKNAISNFIKN